MQQVFTVFLSLAVLCLPGDFTGTGKRTVTPVGNSSRSRLGDAQTSEPVNYGAEFPARAGKTIFDSPPAFDWRVVAGNETVDKLMMSVAGPSPANFNLPLFSADNRDCSGLVGNGRELDSKAGQKHLVFLLKDIFRNEGIPHNLIWIVEVESSFNAEAESSAGAVGLFQFMPATAQRFGLQLFPADDRKMPYKSAKAAAEYLRFLRDEFGCWTLALAAYNAGEGRVWRAMKENDARTFQEVAQYLPSETRRYVQRVITTMALREDQARGIPSAFFMP
jgi:hypothetical protein